MDMMLNFSLPDVSAVDITSVSSSIVEWSIKTSLFREYGN